MAAWKIQTLFTHDLDCGKADHTVEFAWTARSMRST